MTAEPKVVIISYVTVESTAQSASCITVELPVQSYPA